MLWLAGLILYDCLFALQVSVTLPDRPGPPAAAAVLFTSYASGSVYRAVTEYAAAVPASNGAAASMAAAVLLQLTSGSVLRYSPGQQLQVLNTAAAFPKPCCYMWALPPASALQLGGAAPALGLAASGKQPHSHGSCSVVMPVWHALIAALLVYCRMNGGNVLAVVSLLFIVVGGPQYFKLLLIFCRRPVLGQPPAGSWCDICVAS